MLRQAQSVAANQVPEPHNAAAPDPDTAESVVVVMPLDVAALLIDVRALSAKLERLHQVNRSDLPVEQGRELAGSLQSLARLVNDLLH
jgi:hypothetical protein